MAHDKPKNYSGAPLKLLSSSSAPIRSSGDLNLKIRLKAFSYCVGARGFCSSVKLGLPLTTLLDKNLLWNIKSLFLFTSFMGSRMSSYFLQDINHLLIWVKYLLGRPIPIHFHKISNLTCRKKSKVLQTFLPNEGNLSYAWSYLIIRVFKKMFVILKMSQMSFVRKRNQTCCVCEAHGPNVLTIQQEAGCKRIFVKRS